MDPNRPGSGGWPEHHSYRFGNDESSYADTPEQQEAQQNEDRPTNPYARWSQARARNTGEVIHPVQPSQEQAQHNPSGREIPGHVRGNTNLALPPTFTRREIERYEATAGPQRLHQGQQQPWERAPVGEDTNTAAPWRRMAHRHPYARPPPSTHGTTSSQHAVPRRPQPQANEPISQAVLPPSSGQPPTSQVAYPGSNRPRAPPATGAVLNRPQEQPGGGTLLPAYQVSSREFLRAQGPGDALQQQSLALPPSYENHGQSAPVNDPLPIFSTFRTYHLRPANLPTSTDEDTDPPICSICLDVYDSLGHRAMQVDRDPCRHVFGLSCLNELFSRRRLGMTMNRCPMCRTVWFQSEVLQHAARREVLGQIPAPAPRGDPPRTTDAMAAQTGLRLDFRSVPQEGLPPGHMALGLTFASRDPRDIRDAEREAEFEYAAEVMGVGDAFRAMRANPPPAAPSSAVQSVQAGQQARASPLDGLVTDGEAGRPIGAQRAGLRDARTGIVQMEEQDTAVRAARGPLSAEQRAALMQQWAQREQQRQELQQHRRPGQQLQPGSETRTAPQTRSVQQTRTAQYTSPGQLGLGPHTGLPRAAQQAPPRPRTPLPEELGWPNWFPADAFSENPGTDPGRHEFRNGGQPFLGAMWYVMINGRTSLDMLQGQGAEIDRVFDGESARMERIGNSRWSRVPIRDPGAPQPGEEGELFIRFQEERQLDAQRETVAEYLRRRYPYVHERLGIDPLGGPGGIETFLMRRDAQQQHPRTEQRQPQIRYTQAPPTRTPQANATQGTPMTQPGATQGPSTQPQGTPSPLSLSNLRQHEASYPTAPLPPGVHRVPQIVTYAGGYRDGPYARADPFGEPPNPPGMALPDLAQSRHSALHSHQEQMRPEIANMQQHQQQRSDDLLLQLDETRNNAAGPADPNTVSSNDAYLDPAIERYMRREHLPVQAVHPFAIIRAEERGEVIGDFGERQIVRESTGRAATRQMRRDTLGRLGEMTFGTEEFSLR